MMQIHRRTRIVLLFWSLAIPLGLPACSEPAPKPVVNAPPAPAGNDPGPATAGGKVTPIQVK